MAPTTKRMSMEEKRQVVLKIYHTTKKVYTEKEILNLAIKAGVNQGTVADVNNALVDDGLVSKEKISGSNYFWSFPGKADRLAQIQYQSDVQEVERLENELQIAKAAFVEAQKGREDDEHGTRATNLAQLASLMQQKAALQKEYNQLKENDPQALADLEKELQLVTDATHRWTDNIFNCYSYLTKKKGMDKKQARRLLGITDSFDYPESK